MLDLIEKITAGLCAFVVLAVTAGYAFIGVPDTTPREFIRAVEPVDIPAAPPGAPPRMSPESAPVATHVQNLDNNKLKDALQKQGVRVRSAVPRKHAPIPSDLFEQVQHEANWMKELKQYKSIIVSSPQGNTRLQISGIRENSLLQKLGLEDGDTLELVNGEIIEFSEQSTMKLRSIAKDAIETLRAGKAVSITISRGGNPVQFNFNLPRR